MLTVFADTYKLMMQHVVQIPQPPQLQNSQQAQPVPQQIIVTSDPSWGVRYDYAHRRAMGLGITQLIIGIFCIMEQSIAMVAFASWYFVGTGIWCGVMFVIAGAFGIASSKSQTMCYIVTFMVMSIMSAIFVLALLILSALGLVVDQYAAPFGNCEMKVRVALQSALLILAVAEWVFAIWSSTLGCVVCCCSTPDQPGLGQHVFSSPTAMQQTQVRGAQQRSRVRAPFPDDQHVKMVKTSMVHSTSVASCSDDEDYTSLQLPEAQYASMQPSVEDYTVPRHPEEDYLEILP